MNIPELSGSWKLVMSGLFKQLGELIRSKADEYPGPWMLRADGRESNWARNGDVPPTITSLSFPYFELGPIQDHGKKYTRDRYPPMSLNQWRDRTDAARQWDTEQSYSQMAEVKNGENQSIYGNNSVFITTALFPSTLRRIILTI